MDRFMAAYVLASGRSVLFIDSGWDEKLAAYMLDKALGLLAESGFRPQNYYLLNTHCDWDHAWANRAFKRKLGAPLRVGASLETFLAMRQDLRLNEVERRQQGSDGAYFRFAFIELPDLLWADGENIYLDDLEVQFIKVSAHSEGQLAVWAPQHRLLFAADSCEGPLSFPKNCSCLTEQLDNFRRLIKLHPQQVWPAHHIAWSQDNFLAGSGAPIGEPKLLVANYNYYRQLEQNLQNIRSLSFKAACKAWLQQNRALLYALFIDEEGWSQLEGRGKPAFLTQLEMWEAYLHVNIEQLAQQTGQGCSNWFYQRAHHMAALMVMENYLK